MAKLTDADIVALAVGLRITLDSRTWFKIGPREIARLSEDKTIRERGRKIVLREVVRLTRGEDVEKQMRTLIAIWCAQQCNGGKRGRPSNVNKEHAIYVAWLIMRVQIEKLNPKPQRKVIIAELADYFGVKPRRVYEALKRQEPPDQRRRSCT